MHSILGLMASIAKVKTFLCFNTLSANLSKSLECVYFFLNFRKPKEFKHNVMPVLFFFFSVTIIKHTPCVSHVYVCCVPWLELCFSTWFVHCLKLLFFCQSFKSFLCLYRFCIQYCTYFCKALIDIYKETSGLFFVNYIVQVDVHPMLMEQADNFHNIIVVFE